MRFAEALGLVFDAAARALAVEAFLAVDLEARLLPALEVVALSGSMSEPEIYVEILIRSIPGEASRISVSALARGSSSGSSVPASVPATLSRASSFALSLLRSLKSLSPPIAGVLLAELVCRVPLRVADTRELFPFSFNGSGEDGGDGKSSAVFRRRESIIFWNSLLNGSL